MAKKILLRKFWNDDKEVNSLSRIEFLKALKDFGEQENIPNISWIGVNTLRFFLELKQPKKVMEIGCANGFSSIVIADSISPWNGKLFTCDVSTPAIASAKENWRVCNIQNIEVREGSALEVFEEDKKQGREEEKNFDCIFIDAQKSWTHKFFEFASKKIAPGGIIIIDDTKKFKDKMKSFKNLIEREKNHWIFFEIPEYDDALMVFTRRENLE